jgi:hypothetical protein
MFYFMYMLKILHCLILLSCATFIIAQQPDEALNRYGAQIPIEKTYLHFDRSDYVAGQYMWFKAYQYADLLPSNQSTTLYVELLNNSSSLIARKILPVFMGVTTGQIELPDTLSEGQYLVRAYSIPMLNHSQDFLFRRSFFITGRKKQAEAASLKAASRLEFFPEGGNLVTGLINTVAYKATNAAGLPVSIKGQLKKETGETVAQVSSFHDGMGYFDLQPKENERYYVLLDDDVTGKKYPLPDQTKKGVVFKVISSGKAKFFEILQHDSDPMFKAAYMVGQMQHHVVFRTGFPEQKNEIQGNIQTDALSSGILHITVFNKQGMPLAERLTFVNNKEYLLPSTITFDTLNFSSRSRNNFTVALKDTIRGNFSVSITDASFESSQFRQDNILSSLLLTSDIKGYVHTPAWYFSADTDSVQNSLDLVMMTNGWRRFRWDALLKQPAVPKKLVDPGYISLSGTINLEGTKKPLAEKELMMMIVGADSSKTMQMIRTDAAGRYTVDSLLFFNKAKIFFSDIKGKKSKFILVKPDGDSLSRSYPLTAELVSDHFPAVAGTAASKTMLDREYDAILKEGGLMLHGVTVKGRSKTKLEEYEQKYVSGLFSGDALRTLDLTGQDLIAYRNIFDYLQSKVPGLDVSVDGLDYTIYLRQQATLSGMGSQPATLFLDEIETDASFISTIPASQIAMVKVFSNFVGASGNGAGGVLAIYTKKGSDYLNTLPSAGDIIQYQGYSVIREFYSPDYKVNTTNNSQPDNRMTLLWNPAVFVNNINPRIPISFYNSDRTKRYKIVVEGMTIDGKMLMIEKTIPDEPKKAF